MIKEAEKQKAIVKKLYKNINDQAAKVKLLIARHRADATQRFSNLNKLSVNIETKITSKTSKVVNHLDAHSTSIKLDLNEVYETMKGNLEKKMKSIEDSPIASLRTTNHAIDICEGNHDPVENKLKSYVLSKIKELSKSIATRLTAMFKIQENKLTKQIRETHPGMLESAIKDLITTTCVTSSFLVNMINDKVMTRIDDSMMEVDDKISKAIAAKVRKERQRTAKQDGEVVFESEPDYNESNDEI